MRDRDLVVRGRDSPWMAKTWPRLHQNKAWWCALFWCLPCFQGEWGTRVARPRTVFGFVSTARLETCENIVRIGLAFWGSLAGRAWARLRSMAQARKK